MEKRKGVLKMKKYHKIEDMQIEEKTMSMKIDGKRHTYKFAEISPKLAGAPLSKRMNFEVSASGYGIHWPELDEDISIDGLLGVKHEFPAIACMA
jgi:hypothetical protein